MFSSMDWGRTGHQVVGALAQQYLTPRLKNRSKDCWMEFHWPVFLIMEIKLSRSKISCFRPWHYINLPLEESYANAKKNPKGE